MKLLSKAFVLSAFFCIQSPLALADAKRTEKFTEESFKCQITLEKNWEQTPKIFGFSTLLTTGKDKSRISVGLVVTLLKAEGFDEKNLQKEMDSFKKDKEEWVKENEGSILRKMEFSENTFEPNSVKTSVSYKVESDEHLELTYFYFRNSYLVHAKALLNEPQKDHSKSIKSFEDSLRSLACSKD